MAAAPAIEAELDRRGISFNAYVLQLIDQDLCHQKEDIEKRQGSNSRGRLLP